jgi:hypothetical protein
MTVATDTTLVWRAATTTEMYNWIKRISDALTAVGCVLTSDAGQISLAGTTVAIPTSADETFKQAGYQIRKLERSGYPTLFIRIDYGVRRYNSFSTAANNVAPCIRITVGTETNGAGVLGGVHTTAGRNFSDWGYYCLAELVPAGVRPLFFSSDGQNYLTMVIDPALAGGTTSYRASSNVPLVFALERSVTPETGAYDSDGYVIVSPLSSPPSGEGWATYTVANIPGSAVYSGGTSQSVPAQNPGLFTSSFSAGSTNLFPVTVCLPKPKGPMISVLYYYKADIADGYTLSTTMYGATRTFIAAGGLQPQSAVVAANTVSAALRYD